MRDNYGYQADDIAQFYECVNCGETLIFSKHARFEEVRKALESHACAPTALRLTEVTRDVPACVH